VAAPEAEDGREGGPVVSEIEYDGPEDRAIANHLEDGFAAVARALVCLRAIFPACADYVPHHDFDRVQVALDHVTTAYRALDDLEDFGVGSDEHARRREARARASLGLDKAVRS